MFLVFLLAGCGSSSDLDDINNAFNDLGDALPSEDPCTADYYSRLDGTYTGSLTYSRTDEAGDEFVSCTWFVNMTLRHGSENVFYCGIRADISALVTQTYEWPSSDDKAHQCRSIRAKTDVVTDSNSLTTDPAIVDQTTFPQGLTFSSASEVKEQEGPYLGRLDGDQVANVDYIYLFDLISGAAKGSFLNADGTIRFTGLDSSQSEQELGFLTKQ